MTGQIVDVARVNMLRNQLMPNGVVSQELLGAMAEIKRETFIPTQLADIAYTDSHIPVSASRVMLSPHLLAFALQAALPLEGKSVLDAQGATGYTAAVLSALCKNVIVLEADSALRNSAKKCLKGMAGIVISDDVDAVLKNKYDAIFCLSTMIEDAEATTLFAALKDGGSLVYLHKASNSIAKLMLVRKIQGLAGTQELLEIPYGA